MKTTRIVAAVAAFVAAAAFGETVIEGRWTVVYPEYPKEQPGMTRGFRDMAVVLSDVLGESVGAKVAVVAEGNEPKGPGRRFFMGGKFAEAAGLMPADFKGYDWGIAEKDGDIYFFGRDRVGSSPRYETRCVLPSALAASKFMTQEMGVLFVMPGRIGREVPKLKRLAVPKGFFRRGAVKTEFVCGYYCDYGFYMANGMYGAGATHTYSGHTYPNACPRAKYRDTHPEYFAKDEKGKPMWGGSDGCQAYCISNPDFLRLVYEELLRRYDAGADVCELGQNDGPAGRCRCESCRNLYGIGVNTNQDDRTVYGCTGDWREKLWLYHKEIAERIMRDRPGKLVQIISYGDTADPPKSFREFPPNVMIEVCSYSEEAMRKWDGYTVPHGFTYYVYNWGFYQLLGLTPKRSFAGLVRQMQRFHRYGMKGIYLCGFGEMFGMEGPQYWVFNHLIENPNANVRGALAQYYGGAFGPAAVPMKRFYEDLEAPLAEVEKLQSTKASDLVESTLKIKKGRTPIDALSIVYTPERVARMDSALKEAETTPGLSPKQARRLGLVRLEWNYVRNVGLIAYKYGKFREHPTKDACFEILGLLRERNAMIDGIYPGGKYRGLKDWPEIRLFGVASLDQIKVNGRLSAPIKVPLTWDVEKMLKYRMVPNEIMTPKERAAELRKAGVKPLTGFTMDAWTMKRPGVTFEPYPDGTGFKFGQGTNTHVRVSARIGAKQGLLPGKTYRISWLARWDDVNVKHPWHGFYFSATYDFWSDKRPMVEEPSEKKLSGTSNGWRRESIVMKVCDKPNFASEFTFRFWGGKDGVAEVRDVAIEEVE